MSGGGLGHRNESYWWTVSTRDKAYLQPLNKTDISAMAKQIFPNSWYISTISHGKGEVPTASPRYPFGFSSFPATSQQPLLLPLPTGISKDWRVFKGWWVISWDTCSITDVFCNMAIRFDLGIHIHNKTDPKFETVDIPFTPEIIIVRTSLWISLQLSHCLKRKAPQEGIIL